MTQAAFRKFEQQFKTDGLEGEDLDGCPVNLERGKEEGKLFSEVTSVSFYPKMKITLPDDLPDFEQLPEFDEGELQTMSQKIDDEMESLIQMQMASGKKSAKKSAKKSGRRK